METIICKKYCSFYKPDKDEQLKCGTFDFLCRNLTRREILQASERIPAKYDLSKDERIKKMICDKCDFRTDGCDFRDGVDSPPCGGYTVVEHLLKH